MKQRSRSPDVGEVRGAIVPPAAGRFNRQKRDTRVQRIDQAGDPHRRKLLLGVGRKICPYVSGHCVAAHRPSDIGSDLGDRMTRVVGEKVVIEEIVLHDRFAIPVNLSSLAALWRTLAGMTPGALLGEDRLTACNDSSILGSEGLAAIGVGKMQWRESAKER